MMRARSCCKQRLKKSLLVIVAIYLLLAGSGMVLWSVVVVPTLSRRTLLENTEKIQRYAMKRSGNGTRVSVRPLSVVGGSSGVPPSQYFEFFSGPFNVSDETARRWLGKKTAVCGSRIEAYGNEFIRFRDVVVDPGKSRGRLGGENLAEVMNQTEEAEYLTLRPGFFTLRCPEQPSYVFNGKNHLNDWLKSVVVGKFFEPIKIFEKRFTIGVQRYEYVNLFHTMTDFYNAFLMMVVFKQEPESTRVLWVDAHPYGSLDRVWDVLFGGHQRVKHLKQPVMYRDMVWNMMGYNSPLLNFPRSQLPYVEEFREFFLTRYLQNLHKPLNCSRLSVLFVWRHDYVAHPRNPKGLVSRKIRNEGELVSRLRDLLKGHDIRGIQLDSFEMEAQLKWIANTDILIGMHGAGLTHALFIPKHAGLVELFPTYWSDMNQHFQSIAKWRKLKYVKWQNSNYDNEYNNDYTYIPPSIVVNMVSDVKKQICTD